MEWLSLASKFMLLIFLGIAALADLKEKKIPIVFAACGFVLGLTTQLIIGELKFYEIIGGCLLGALLLLIAKLTNEAVGYGDGLMFVATGAFLGIINNVVLLMAALVIAAAVSIALLLAKRKKKKYVMPFVPFMLSGYVLILAVY